MSKKNKGSAYIFVLMIIMIASLVVNLIISNINLKFEKKHGENNNLYYMAKYGSDIALCVLNEIVSSCYIVKNEKKDVDKALFYNSFKKYFEGNQGSKVISLALTDELDEKKLIYNVNIVFKSLEILKYDIDIEVINSYGNKIKLNQVIKYNDEREKFVVEQEEIE